MRMLVMGATFLLAFGVLLCTLGIGFYSALVPGSVDLSDNGSGNFVGIAGFVSFVVVVIFALSYSGNDTTQRKSQLKATADKATPVSKDNEPNT